MRSATALKIFNPIYSEKLEKKPILEGEKLLLKKLA